MSTGVHLADTGLDALCQHTVSGCTFRTQDEMHFADHVSVTIPPLIISQPEKSMAFREGESIEMPCVASGQPDPM